jgi:hypothetical protein
MACCDGRNWRSHGLLQQRNIATAGPRPSRRQARSFICAWHLRQARFGISALRACIPWQPNRSPRGSPIARLIPIDSGFADGISHGTSSTPGWASGAVRGQLEDELSQFGFSSFGLAIVRHSGPRRVKRLSEDDQRLGIKLSHRSTCLIAFSTDRRRLSVKFPT